MLSGTLLETQRDIEQLEAQRDTGQLPKTDGNKYRHRATYVSTKGHRATSKKTVRYMKHLMWTQRDTGQLMETDGDNGRHRATFTKGHRATYGDRW